MENEFYGSESWTKGQLEVFKICGSLEDFFEGQRAVQISVFRGNKYISTSEQNDMAGMVTKDKQRQTKNTSPWIKWVQKWQLASRSIKSNTGRLLRTYGDSSTICQYKKKAISQFVIRKMTKKRIRRKEMKDTELNIKIE